MVDISVMIEGQDGLTWPRWQRLMVAAEEFGFAGLFRSDHFTNARPPDKNSLETIVSLTYVADHSRRIQFGTLVAPLSFRDPAILARQAASIDDLSGGRMILGVGAGWQEREHSLFGFNLGDINTRMARFEEGLEVITRLLHSNEPVTYEGKFFQLRGAMLLPRPARSAGPPIMIGGNGMKRTLPLVARFADIWNGLALTPDAFRQHSQRLDELLLAQMRKPGDVRRTMMTTLYFGRDMEELDRRLSWRLNVPELADRALIDVLETLHTSGRAIVGTPDMVIKQIQAYVDAGVQELMMQWLDMDNIEGLRAFSETVLPQVQ
ncbi:MAG TPA: TIGR03560 family F420-dependent LLM class oxidoreductase [Ktedonobacteraceae bacterium]|nr:TIGR03560 family F420-dependent LLM class oxidoreductase [Ktedonobacteraceae bacterium]